MASTPLTLAALATSAVPGLDVLAYRTHGGGGDGAFSSVVLATPDREVMVRVPRTSAAEVRQSAEMLGLSALAEGARSALPFEVSQVLGITRAGDTRAVVSVFLPGDRIDVDALEIEALLLQPIAEALAAIHELPARLVQDAGLPIRSAAEVRRAASRIVERASETRLLPELVQHRWLDVLGTDRVWDFAPTVVHGSFDAEQLLVSDDRVVGVLGWDELSIGDPAADLAWLLAAGPEVFDGVLARYSVARGARGGTELRQRAHFHHELDVARWLLHGIETHDQSIIDDAITMLDRLVDRVSRLGESGPLSAATSPEEVERLLDELPDVPVDPRSETAEYEALDEDRAFLIERDFDDEPDSPDR